MTQQTLAMAQDPGFERYRKPTRRDVFLETTDRAVGRAVRGGRAGLSQAGQR